MFHIKNIFKKKIVLVIAVYWMLLLYVLAALFWWFIALNRQNARMSELSFSVLHKDSTAYYQEVQQVYDAQQRKKAQYVGEGVAFFAVIIFAAYFVFRATMRHLKLSQQQQNFMMAVTHELKTPIAIVRLNIETLQRRQLTDEYKQKILSDSLSETDRLNDLCNNILVTSQLETGNYTCLKEPFDLNSLIAQTTQDFSNRFSKRTIIYQPLEESVYLNGEQMLIQLLLNNLIENALKYSAATEPVTVELREDKDKIKLTVIDNGPGIIDDEKKKVFTKFYRSGDENKRKTKGTGLGLYLCKKIVQSHDGSISITDNLPHGSIFTVTFITS